MKPVCLHLSLVGHFRNICWFFPNPFLGGGVELHWNLVVGYLLVTKYRCNVGDVV